VSTDWNGKCPDTFQSLPTYIIRYTGGADDEFGEVACEDVHGEWEVVKEAPIQRKEQDVKNKAKKEAKKKKKNNEGGEVTLP